MKKMLVVYYSWSNGNTKRIAEQLTNGTGADIARIETTEPYSGSHEDVVEQGKREVEAGGAVLLAELLAAKGYFD